MDSVGPDGQKRNVEEDREDWKEDMQEPHRYFYQIKEHAYHADDEVVLCVAESSQCCAPT